MSKNIDVKNMTNLQLMVEGSQTGNILVVAEFKRRQNKARKEHLKVIK